MKARLPEGYSGKGNNMNSMSQAQKMQEEMTRVQGELEEREFSATSGGGAVEVVVTGKKLVKSIDPNAYVTVTLISDLMHGSIEK